MTSDTTSVSGISQWHHPSLSVSGTTPTPASSSKPSHGHDEKPSLPAGYISQIDKKGRTFYVNVATGISQWEHPSAVTAAVTPTPGTLSPPIRN